MRRLVLGLLGATALVIGTGANAATVAGTYDGIDSTNLNTYLTEGFGETQSVANVGGSFSTDFSFDLFTDVLANAQISSKFASLTDIDFSSIWLDGLYQFTQTGSDPLTETWELLVPVGLDAGTHTITVNGNVNGRNRSGSYVGNINIAPVPEPATWAMMLLGFGAVGFAMRRSRRPALLQVA
jgi:PEP-CTERM motif